MRPERWDGNGPGEQFITHVTCRGGSRDAQTKEAVLSPAHSVQGTKHKVPGRTPRVAARFNDQYKTLIPSNSPTFN